MAANGIKDPSPAFLGAGWSFPPEFAENGRGVAMVTGEEDIESSLRILFGTITGERFLTPEYGLNPRELLFEPAGTTANAFLKDRIKTAILIHEPRIEVLSLEVEAPDPNDGRAQISLSYAIRATNSRFNLVYPFYRHDGSEVGRTVTRGARR